MENNKKKEEDLQSRREFFKKVGKGVLPILGAAVLSALPVEEAKAQWGCNYSCQDSCSRGCRGTCNSQCRGDCTSTCGGMCGGQCTGSCRGTCKGYCSGSSGVWY